MEAELSGQMAEVAALNANAGKAEKEAAELRKAAARHQKECAWMFVFCCAALLKVAIAGSISVCEQMIPN